MASTPQAGERAADAAAAAGSEPAADARLITAMLHRAAGLLWTTDRAQVLRFVAGTVAEPLGLRVGTAIGDSALAGAAGLDAHRRALAGETVRYELRTSAAVLSCLVEPLRDAAARPVGVFGSAEDITERSRAAEFLTTQRNLLEIMLDQSIVGIGLCAADGKFLFSNAALRHFARHEPTEHAIQDAIHVWGDWNFDGRPLPVEEWPLARALRGETAAPCEMYRDGADGRRDHLLVAAAPVRDAGGTLLGCVVSVADITQRKQMEEETRALNDRLEQRVRERTLALERAQQTLRDFFDHSTAVIYVKDLDSRYLLINRHFERVFQVTGADVVGRTTADLFPAETAAALRANDLRVLSGGESLQTEEAVPTAGAERTYLSVKFPLRDPHGTVYGLCGISTDITERKRIEAELRRSQATLTAVIESALDPIWAVDANLDLLAFNAAAATLIEAVIGTTPGLGGRMSHLVPTGVLPRWHGYLRRALAGERFTVEEALPLHGVPHRLLVSLTPMLEDGRVTGVAAFTKDITELMRAEEQARRHQAELAHALRVHTMGELVASLAHEVNQPLGAIANYAQGARRRLESGALTHVEMQANVEAIAHEALRAGEITRRVRELLRKEEAPRTLVDLNEIVAKALRVAEPAARDHGVRLSASADAALPAALADAIQIEQVVFNLLLNGIEAAAATDGARAVSVRTAAVPEGVEIVVRDSGGGVDPRIAGEIFEPFLTTKPGGLGMGLAISRSIIEAHGGRLWAAPGAEPGAAFHVLLPAAL